MGAQGQGESQTGSWTLAEEGQMLGGAAFLTGLMQEVNTWVTAKSYLGRVLYFHRPWGPPRESYAFWGSLLSSPSGSYTAFYTQWGRLTP